MKKTCLLLVISLVAFTISCKKTPDEPKGNNKIVLGVTTADTVSYISIAASVSVNSLGGNQITQHGFCWNTFTNPDISGSHSSLGPLSDTGRFSEQIIELISNTKYYIRPYLTYSYGTLYGQQIEATTKQITAPTVSTSSVTNITQTTATSGGNVTSDGGSSVTARGVCWSASPNPTLINSHTTIGTGTGQFTSNLTGLTPNTLYYVRAYAINSVGTAYGNDNSFTTGATIPTVTTTSVSNITQTTATSGGNVTSDGGSSVTARGVCWSTSPNPTLLNSHTSNGTGTGQFTSNLTGLTPNTPYYVRAYATNSIGTAYGNDNSFTTGATISTVTTTSVTNITQTTATSGGNVTSDGGSSVTARGVCWSTLHNPTIANSFTTDGNGIGSFVSNLTGLSSNTLYYVRAYATNSVGTAYGNEVSFVSLSWGQPCPGILTVTYESKTYNTVLIGTQCWFKENLDVGTRINGSQNQTNNGIKEKYCYNDLVSNCDVYGGLYQWDEMMQYVTSQGAKGICPTGWHIPTDAEWTTLTNYLGGESVAGGKIKEAGTAHWASPNTGATNSSGFTALPGGYRYGNGSFYSLTNYAYFWSSSQSGAANAWRRGLGYNNEYVYRNSDYKSHGFSCRCLKDP